MVKKSRGPKVSSKSILPKNWHVVKDATLLKELAEKCANYEVWDMNGRNAIITLGYKVINAGDKETYFLLKGLAKLKDTQGRYYTKVSLNYLAIVLGTSSEGQRKRIQKLESVGLVTTSRGVRTSNVYYVTENPLPDTTYVDTISKLIKRKEVYTMIGAINVCNNVTERIKLIDELSKMDPNGEYCSKEQLITIRQSGGIVEL